MKSLSRLMGGLFFAAVLSSAAFSQGSCYPGQVFTNSGRPANAATVRVCTSGSTGTPCTPTASLFTDPTLGVSASNPLTTDALGNFKICAAAGANYDFQYSGSGITTLTITNVPLPATTPIVAASLTSSSANPANVGLIKLASTDCLDWRNNANSGNIQLCKTAADALDVTAFSSVAAAAFSATSAAPMSLLSGSTGTNLSVSLGRAVTEVNLAIPSANGFFFTNSDLAGGDLVIRVPSSTNRIYLGTGSGIAPVAITNVGENFYGSTSGLTALKASPTASGTLTLPAATDTLVGKATPDTLTNKTIGAGGLAGLTPGHQTFTAGGTHTIPTGLTAEKVTVCAGGGGGGGSTATNNGGGGGSGGCAIKWLTGLTPGNTLTVTIGAGGAAGLTNASGGNGGTSSVASGTQTITTITTNGGGGGNGSLSASPGGGGGAAGTGGDLNLDGNAATFANPTNGQGGAGAASPVFGGAAATSGGAGINAGSFGAGGGGAGGAAAHSGGAGSAGIVLFEWTN
jgi:hypothetical protein